jgi:hypothetical protein
MFLSVMLCESTVLQVGDYKYICSLASGRQDSFAMSQLCSGRWLVGNFLPGQSVMRCSCSQPCTQRAGPRTVCCLHPVSTFPSAYMYILRAIVSDSLKSFWLPVLRRGSSRLHSSLSARCNADLCHLSALQVASPTFVFAGPRFQFPTPDLSRTLGAYYVCKDFTHAFEISQHLKVTACGKSKYSHMQKDAKRCNKQIHTVAGK